MEGIFSTYIDIFKAIEESLDKQRIVPALILTYSAIDSFSFLAEKSDKKGRSVFKAWVKKWMLEKYPLPCSEVDIYAARCGLLHQQISESDLSIEGKAREILYSWGNSKHETLKESIEDSKKRDNYVAVKLEDLLNSFKKGLADCILEIEKDPSWEANFNKKGQKLFISVIVQ